MEFTNNTATNGGAIGSGGSSICFGNISNTKFNSNIAKDDGGAIYIYLDSYRSYPHIQFSNNSHIEFNNNAATRGGAIYSISSFISFEGFSATVFSNNIATVYVGAIIAEDESEITFYDNSTVTFTHNSAPFSEIVYCGSNCKVITKNNSNVMFNFVLPKWCTNICTPYNGQGAVIIDSSGVVRCRHQKAFECLRENCNCKNL